MAWYRQNVSMFPTMFNKPRSKMVKISSLLIRKIKKLGDGSVEDQKNACKLVVEKVFAKKDCIDGSVIPNLLPLIVKLLTSEDESLQQSSAYLIEIITDKSDSLQNFKENIQLVIDQNGTENLVKCLSTSRNEDVIFQCLKCLANISLYFPAEIIKYNALLSINEFLKSKHYGISYRAAEILRNVAEEFKENVLIVLKADGGVTFKRLLESLPFNCQVSEAALGALVSIMSHNAEACQYVLDLGILNLMECVLERLFDDPKKRRSIRLWGTNFSIIQSKIKLSAIRFILNATHFNETQIDMVLQKKFVSTILKYIGSENWDKIKSYSVSIIDNIVQKKSSYIPNLLKDGVISLLYENLETRNSELLEICLTTLYDFIKYSGYSENVRQEIIKCGNPKILQNLFHRKNLKELPKDIHNFVVGNIKVESGIIEKVEPIESGEQNEEEQGSVADIKNVLQSDELVNNTSNVNILLEDDDVVFLETKVSSTHIQNGTLRSKRTMDASEQVGPIAKRRRRSDYSSNESVLKESPNDHPPPPIILNPSEINHDSDTAVTPSSPDQSVVPFLPEVTTSVEINRDQNAFAPIKYFCPHEAVIDSFCETLGLKFDRKKYHEFCSKLNLTIITPDSKPKQIYPTEDKAGFGCFSVFLTGTELSAEKIKNQVVDKYIDSETSKEKLKKIFKSTSMTSELLETIVCWLNCRIMVYSDENGWEIYGDWNSEDKYVPVFVLKKIQFENDNFFEIVLSFD